MRIFWIWFYIAMIAVQILHAEFNRPVTSLDVAWGYRHDNFRWALDREIERNGKNSSSSSSDESSSSSSSFSEDTLYRVYWNNLQIYELAARGSYVSCNNYYIRLNGDYGWIFDGRSRTSANLNLLHPEHETSRIKGKANKGHVADLEGGVGYSFTSNWRRCIVTPLIGWSYHEMELFMQHPKQVINHTDHPHLLGPIPNLTFRYKPRWYGFWAGTDVLVSVETPCLLFYGSAEYHWAQYHAKGHWNFNDDFVDTYTHRTNGQGFIGYLGFNYRLCRCWYVGLVGAYRNWHFHGGKHRTRFLKNDLANPDQAFGTMPIITRRHHDHLKRIHWNSWSAAITIAYRWWIWDQ